MPELPEVETVVRTLRPRLVGRTIAGARLLHPPLLRAPARFSVRTLAGSEIRDVRRRGKLVLIVCRGTTLIFHLKMTGNLLVLPATTSLDKHTRLVLALDGGKYELRFEDIRKFGFLICLKHDGRGRLPACFELDGLGPDALEIDRPSFLRLVKGRKGMIKALLLDQTFLAGIGNIYADEILFASRIHPRRTAASLQAEAIGRLWASMRAVLQGAVAARGSSIRNYRDAAGRPGEYQDSHRVYGREGLSCLRCGAAVRRIKTAGRSSFFCPRCQRSPRKAR